MLPYQPRGQKRRLAEAIAPNWACHYATRMRATLILTALLVACGGEPAMPTSSIDREQFISVYVELGLAQDRSADAGAFQTQKQAVLSRHGVSEAQLKEFVDVHGQRLDFMAEVWDSVRQRMTTTASEAQ